jgi:uncharacterized membrane protein YgaE (UPF0421/DUF939 family)
MNTTRIPASISLTDIQMVAATGLCLLAAKVIPEYQIMTACIAALLCTQEDIASTWKSGLVRLIITAVGGLVAVLVILLDNIVDNSWLLIVMIMAGLLLTLWGCKLSRVPSFNARIGGVTFVLVVLTRSGSDRIYYAVFRLLSTLYGVIVVIAITAVFTLISRMKKNTHGENDSTA